MIKFIADTHTYLSVVPDNKQWKSITSIVHSLVSPFNAEVQAVKSSKNSKSKWYGMSPKDIIQAWEDEKNRSTELGHWWHDKREQHILTTRPDAVQAISNIGIKVARDQRLSDGIYPEHIVYLESAGICGQTDEAEVVNGILNITDAKSSKEIRRNGYIGYDGEKMMLPPVQHLGDCEFHHYSLQLSMYAYIILKHNPLLKIGKLTIEHVKFQEAGQNKYGYPIYEKDGKGGYIVKEVEHIQLPYRAKEVQNIITWLKNK